MDGGPIKEEWRFSRKLSLDLQLPPIGNARLAELDEPTYATQHLGNLPCNAARLGLHALLVCPNP